MSKADLERGLRALASSAEAYQVGESYYTGTVKEYFSSPKIRALLKESGSSFRLNFASIPVDARVNRIEVASAVVLSGDGGSSEALTKILREKVIEANDLDEDLQDFFRKSAYFGDYYVLVEAPEDEEGETPDSVDVFGNSPLDSRMIYSRSNSRKALYWIKLWEDDSSTKNEPVWRVNLVYPDVIEEYIASKDPRQGSVSEADFQELYEIGEDGQPDVSAWPAVNEYGKLPVFHLRQGGKPYGSPVHERVYGAQDAINKLNITHMSTVEFQGFPQRYALTELNTSDDDGDEDFIEFNTSGVVTDETRAAATEIKKAGKLRSGPAETWWLSGVKSVGQFDPAQPTVFTEPMEMQVRSMAVLGNTPLYAFDLKGEQPSGESRRRADGPLKSEVAAMERGYEKTVENLYAFALEVLGHPNSVVKIKWAPFDTSTAKDDWDTILLKLDAGVPLRVALSDAGYDDDEIKAWYPVDAPALSPSMIAKLGQAIGQLGTAVTLGSMSAADVGAILAPYLGVDRAES